MSDKPPLDWAFILLWLALITACAVFYTVLVVAVTRAL